MSILVGNMSIIIAKIIDNRSYRQMPINADWSVTPSEYFGAIGSKRRFPFGLARFQTCLLSLQVHCFGQRYVDVQKCWTWIRFVSFKLFSKKCLVSARVTIRSVNLLSVQLLHCLNPAFPRLIPCFSSCKLFGCTRIDEASSVHRPFVLVCIETICSAKKVVFILSQCQSRTEFCQVLSWSFRSDFFWVSMMWELIWADACLGRERGDRCASRCGAGNLQCHPRDPSKRPCRYAGLVAFCAVCSAMNHFTLC